MGELKISGRSDLPEEKVLFKSYHEREREWIDKLQNQGFKAAHPNDGWVDRESNYVILQYPQFRMKDLAPGDKIMLGWASDNERPVVVTKIENDLLEKIYFTDMENLKNVEVEYKGTACTIIEDNNNKLVLKPKNGGENFTIDKPKQYQ